MIPAALDGERGTPGLKTDAQAEPARPLWSASQASVLDGRTGKAGTASMVGVASERVRRPHRQSRHGLYGRRRKRAPWTAAPAEPARPLWSASQASALAVELCGDQFELELATPAQDAHRHPLADPLAHHQALDVEHAR